MAAGLAGHAETCEEIAALLDQATRRAVTTGERRFGGMVDLAVPLLLSGTGVAIAAIAFYNRDKPNWQRDMRPVFIQAIGLVVLGAVAWVLFHG